MTVVAEEDKSRTIWPSCPASGWKHGVFRLTSQPNGNPLGLVPAIFEPPVKAMELNVMPLSDDANCTYQENVDYAEGTIWKHDSASSKEACCMECINTPECTLAVLNDQECWLKHGADGTKPIYSAGRLACWPKGHGPIPPPPPPPPPKPARIETQYVGATSVLRLTLLSGPYQHGAGFPSVNGGNGPAPFQPNIPITLSPSTTGPQFPNTFASEFGKVCSCK